MSQSLLTVCMLALFAVIAPLSISAAPIGAPTVDGRLFGNGDIDRYQVFSVAPSGSQLLYAFVDNTLYVALLVDRSVNDNVFGNRPYTQNAGWNPPRSARRLIDSEYAEFSLLIGADPNAPDASWTWRQGYAGQPGVGPGNSTNTDATWISDETVSGGGGTPPPGYTGASSFMWNLNNYATNPAPAWNMDVNGTGPNNWKSPFNPAAPDVVLGLEGYPAVGQIGWSETYQFEWPMIYEWSVDMSDFGPQPVFIIQGSSHHSPAKTGGEDDPFPPGDPEPLRDFGDLPGPYPTLLTNDGPRHILVPNGARLGTSVDSEIDGIPHPLALGDDFTGVNDEDGVFLLTPLIPGETATFEVIASTNSYLSAFVDWVASPGGTLTTMVFANVTVPSGADSITPGPIADIHLSVGGTYIFEVEVPAGATGFMPTRWRVTNESGQGGASPTGEALTGEVEDHIFLASLGDRVWIDLDQNGFQDDGEPGLSGVTVNLLDADGDPFLDPVTGDPVTTVTDGDGLYLFTNLLAGEYRLEFIAPAGYSFATQNADGLGFASATNSVADPVTGVSPVVTLFPGEVNLNGDAGLFAEGTIGDTVFFDWNGNGVQDPGEAGIPGVTVTLTPPADVNLGAGDGEPITQVTDANGFYLFTSLPPGEYTVSVPAPGSGGVPAGYTLTASPDDPVSLTHVYNLEEGEIYLDADFGYQPGGVATIGDTVFEDVLRNGVFVPAEGDQGIPNVTLRLYHDVSGNGVIDPTDPIIATTETDGSGWYLFTGLDPNLFYIVEAVDGPGSGVDDYFVLSYGLTTVSNPIAVSPTDFANAPTVNEFLDADFGYNGEIPGSISGYVFEDLNNDGVLDPEDIVIPNVEVILFLLDESGDRIPIDSTFTDNDGYYEFTELPAGKYVVVVNEVDPDIPPGLVTARPEIFVELAQGENSEDNNFPFIPLLEKSVDKALAAAGDFLTYTIIATPPGSGPLENVIVSDPIPPNTVFFSAGQDGQYDAARNRVFWELGSTVPGTQGTLTDRPRMYAFQGGDNPTFWQYDVNDAAWITVEAFSSGVGAGGSLISTVPDGGAEVGDIFGLRGNGTLDFRRFSIFTTPTNVWETLAPVDSPVTVGEGGALATFGGFVYALVGNDSTGFLRYDPATDTWQSLAPAPQTVGRGSAMFTDRQSGLYVLRGNNSPTLWRYDIPSNTWEVRSPAPASVGVGVGGASMVSWAGNLYVVRGENTTSFWRYNMATDTWSTTAVNGDPLPQVPVPVGEGGSAAFRSIRMFVLAGGDNGFVRYNINENTWTALPTPPGTVFNGASLTSAGGRPARENEMFATPTVVRDGDIVTVQVNLSACQNCPDDTNIQPPALEVTGTGGATATYLTGPEPAPQDIPSGISRFYFYTYQVTAGSGTPQSLTFSLPSFESGDLPSVFPPGSANSVIVVPDLTFQVRIDEGFGPGTITNTAQLFGQTVGGLGVCYLLSESLECGDGISRLIRVDIAGSTDMGEVTIPDAAALVWAPDAQFLYVAAGNQFGYLDYSTGSFTAMGDIVDGTGLQGSSGTVNAGDLFVVALAFDASGTLYAVHRRAGQSDLLFQIDPFTGQHVADAFGTGRDYRVIDGTSGRLDIVGLDFAPNGTLFAVAGNANGPFDGDILVTLPDPDVAQDILTPVPVSNSLSPDGLIWADADLNATFNAGEELYDIQGLSITASGIARIVTGDNAPSDNANSILQLNLTSGEAFWLRSPPEACDYQAIVCSDTKPFSAFDPAVTDVLDEPLHTGAIGNFIWLDENSDGFQDAGEPGIPNVQVNLYDADGELVATTVTDANGGYLFRNLAPGTYFVDVLDGTGGQANTLPFDNLVQTPPSTLPGADFGNQDHSSVGIPNTAFTGYQVVLAAGEVNLTADFGYNHASSTNVRDDDGNGAIGDRVWIDANGNGVQDPGEPGLADVTVRLFYDDNGDGTYDALYEVDDYDPVRVTDAAGYYIFENLPPGAYVVVVDETTLPAGYTQTGDPDHFQADAATAPPGTAGDHRTTVPVILAPGDVFLNADFGYQPPPSQNNEVGDRVWLDANANQIGPDGDGLPPGDDNDEYGIRGVTVALILDVAGNGEWSSGDPIIASTITDANGYYLFTGVPDGNYLVWVNDVNGVLLGLEPTYDSDGIGTPNISAVALDPGSANPNPVINLEQDFGYTSIRQTDETGLIGDRVWLDINGDGVQDPDEPGIAGVTVQLFGEFDNLLGTTTTDENGKYYFGGLPPGTYTVVVTPPPGLSQTYDADDGTGPFITPHQSTVTIGGTEPLINLDQDFGYVGTGSIGNFIWQDRNANGLVDGGEAALGIGGVTLDLYWDLSGTGTISPGDPRIGTTTTAPDGSYLFDGLPVDDGSGSASFVVVVSDRDQVLLGYWKSTGPNPGEDNNSQSDPYDVTLNPGTPSNLTADFGYYVDGAALGNRVWSDIDGDGRQDPGEEGLANVTVRLEIRYPNGVTNVITTVSDANGFYSFGNLLLDENQNGVNDATPVFALSVVNPGGGLHHSPHNAPGVPESLNSVNPVETIATVTQGETNVSANPDPSEETSNAWYDFGFTPVPTLAVISGVRSRVEDGIAIISWDVALEVDAVGYYLERWTGDEWIRVSGSMIFADPFMPAPNTYEQADLGVALGSTQRYRIVELDGQGRLLTYGPYDLRIDGGEISYASWAAGIDWGDADSSPDADPDGDGLTNWQEYLAGTDPLDANSVLKIADVVHVPDGVRLTWQSAENRTYAIEMAPSLQDSFLAVRTRIDATPPENVEILPVTAPGAFFRVVVE